MRIATRVSAENRILGYVQFMRRLFFFLGLFLVAVWFLSRPVSAPEKFSYGVTFSVPYARDVLGLDWKKPYRAMFGDLGVKKIRLPAYWTEYEPERGIYDFSDLDFMLGEAKRREASVILAIGQKLPRWPECHIPPWAKKQSNEERHRDFLKYLETAVTRYRGNIAIHAWQVENEPFLPFGECDEYDRKFLDVAVSRLRALDDRPVIITDSGELSLWAFAYRRADIFGTTMYRTVWNQYIGVFTYPLRPGYFRFKARLMEYLFGEKPIVVVELQAEPWHQKLLPEVSLEEQDILMNPEKFRANLEYEKETGFSEVYLWGVEWWYWLKEKHGKPEMWNEAKKLFSG